MRYDLRPALLIATALSTTTIAPAHAFELFGRCLFGKCDSQKNSGDGIEFIDPRTYDVDFTVTGDEDLEGSVQGASALWNGRNSPVGGAAGIVSRARGDYKRILASLYNEGHYGPTISITVNGQEAANITPGFETGENATIVVNVATGPKYAFGTAEILNQAPLAIDMDDEVKLPAEEGFAPGEEARATKVRQAGQLSIEAWRQQGFAKARIADRQATAVHPDNQLNVTIRMEPGRKAAFGEVDVDGVQYMDPAFVAYMTGLDVGEEYDPDELKRARKRLERLGVFSLQRITEADEIGQNGLLPISVLVKERKLRRFGVGATFSSIDGAGAETYWLHRNLFGRAESLRLSAEIGGVGAGGQVGAVQELDYLVEATFKKPGILDPDTDLLANLFAKSTFNDTFSETSAGGSVGLTRYQTERLTLKGSVFAEYGEFDDFFGVRRFGTVGAEGEVEYDLRNDKLDPTSGTYWLTTVRPFYEWEQGSAAFRAEGEGRVYFSPGDSGRTVFAARAKLGSLLGPDIQDSPPDQLFTAGGGGSVRGYGFKNIGIRRDDDEVTGGKTLAEGSIEFRQRFGNSFGAVAFADAGIVGSEAFPDFAEDVKIGVGVGIRYYTGLGPIRVDVALPLTPDEGDPAFGIYAGIGHSF